MFLLRQQLIKISLVVGLVVVLGVLLLVARPVGSTFANGGLQLTVGSHSFYNGDFQGNQSWALKDLVPGVDKFFDLHNILPGDRGVNMMSVQVDGNDAYICLDIINTTDEENGGNEPESHEDTTPEGELSSVVELFSWRDDGDGVFEVGETPLFGTSTESAIDVLNNQTFPLADAANEEIFLEGVTYYVGIEWCFGDLVVDLNTAAITCNGEPVGNEYQTDSFSFDASLRAVEVTSYTDFTCDPYIDLFLEKKFSGPALGFTPDQFSFHVMGSSSVGFEYIDEIVPHGQTVELPPGFFTITELTPEGFNGDDWRIQWSGDECTGVNVPNSIGEIEITPRDIRKGTTYCRVDNQFRPESNPNNNGNNGHGNDEDGNDNSNPGNSNDSEDNTDDDGLPPGQQQTSGPPGRESQRWTRVERSPLNSLSNSRLNRLRL